ncbi:hypothetical protein Lgra_1143 [Legionella gratiana]|uniref:Uncharacterized protein n=1 Tax=Legionella gratiana TaxID=45066 RepID=A0A378IZG4_9GAMM|nr:hypothetical protein [Legionella gratiana]KTD11685.1 hypothetical protein Lgra_1143 [Legionella gratiana]STX40853.1 Uncharacterised protein [Legionella gratiana]
MYDKRLNTLPQKHSGSLNVINLATHDKDGFRLYTCSPIHYNENQEIVRVLEPEVRFRANKKINGTSIGQAIKQKNSLICFQITMNIVNKIILADIQLTKHKHKVFINKLWSGLNNEHKKEIVRTIYEKKPHLLTSKESVYNTIISGEYVREFFNLVCQNHPITTPATVSPEKASRIIFINANVHKTRQGSESVALYTKKHPHECCIVYNKSALEKVLKLHQDKDQAITLIIFADNNFDKKKKCLDWSLDDIGNELGKIVKTYSCIGHLNLFICYSGSLEKAKLYDATCYEKSKGTQDLSRALSVYPKSLLLEDNPFETGTIAHQICQIVFPAVHEKHRGPVMISASPRYIHNNESRFIGSSQGIPYYPHRFNEDTPLLHYKRITVFIGEPRLFQGVCLSKLNEHKESHSKVTLCEKDHNTAPRENGLLLEYGFFKQQEESSPDHTTQCTKDYTL